MALKSVFDAMKREGYVVKDLDLYLLSLNDGDNDRAIDVNAPSQAGKCIRANYFSRTETERDSNSVDARTRRIFDNGSGVHERLQTYLKEAGVLLMDEIPVHNPKYNIQGHTDGLLKIRVAKISDKVDVLEAGILEIKSINNNGFTSLKEPKDEHKRQGLIYIYCVEERRQYLQKKYKNRLAFNLSKKVRMKEYAELYTHIKGGRKHSREEKILHQCSLHDLMDTILYGLKFPVTKAIFLYENKDNQELKEYCISSNSVEAQEIMKEVLKECEVLNGFVAKRKIPPRPDGCTKSSNNCRFCSYKIECWN